MIGWGEVYKVVEAMVPLYVALGLGYASVRRWRFFTSDQCTAIHSLVIYFVFPLFIFDFTAHIDPFAANYRVLAADALSKLLTALLLAAWCRWYGWSDGWPITIFSLAQLTNALVVGAPLFEAMYGRWAQDVIVQISVAQGIVWVPLLLFALETMKARNHHETSSYVALMKRVTFRLAVNPNMYASHFGVAWALLSKRWHIKMPIIVENSVTVMAKAGTGLSMFSLGLFMSTQDNALPCKIKHAILGLVVKFIIGPAITAIGAFAVRLHGHFLVLAIIQNALPLSMMSFVVAREYGLHADVMSCGVIFGTIIALPVLVAYHAVLGFLS